MRLQAGDDARSDRVIVIYKHEINRLGGNLLFARRGIRGHRHESIAYIWFCAKIKLNRLSFSQVRQHFDRLSESGPLCFARFSSFLPFHP